MIPRHPFDRVPRDGLLLLGAALFAAWAALTPILAWVAPPHGVTELARAGTADGVVRVLENWSVNDRLGFAFMLGFDFLYDLVHNNAVAVACIWSARRLAAPGLRDAGHALAWLLWGASVLNVVENLAFFHVLRAGAFSPWPELGTVLFDLRSLILALGLLYWLALGVAWASYRHRAAR